MQEFNKPQSASRFTRPHTLALALALVAVGGVTLAATGGVAKLKSWLIRVEINGQATEVALDENGEATFDVETDDGGTATVQIKKSAGAEGEEMTRIEVTKDDGANINENEKVICKTRGAFMQGDLPAFTLDDFGDAEPVKSWSSQDGQSHALYILPAETGEGSRLFLVTTEGENTHVNMLAATPFSLLAGDVEPEINVAADGTISILLDDGEGNVREMKLKVQQRFGDAELPSNVKVEMPDGSMTITVEDAEDAG